ncbi:MAG TPA: GIY-YIG nuclease family protein [Candidatus Angelobacter sp.]|jgi:putative endonuclease
MKSFWVYIMSNKSRRLYTGFAANIVSRVVEHKEKLYPDSFTARYQFDTLVWYEHHSSAISARMREVEIKCWRREKKLNLILEENPDWADLSLEWQENPGWILEPDAQWRIRRRVKES